MAAGVYNHCYKQHSAFMNPAPGAEDAADCCLFPDVYMNGVLDGDKTVDVRHQYHQHKQTYTGGFVVIQDGCRSYTHLQLAASHLC